MSKYVSAVAIFLAAAPALADSAGGLSWAPPASWKADAPRPMRAATYKLPAAKGDTEDGECGVFYFGQGQGGSVDMNVQRWVGQFEGAKAPTPKKEKVSGFELTTLELDGTYTGGGGPMGPKTSKAGYKLLGAIVEGPEGAIFFKLTGPAKTVEAARADFAKMVKAIKK
ncbi:MAG: hypothetical protein IPJ65_31455 [Archangiaceae bacterium]|nr:hypothetical protein [Archangiaceae bacterium]